MPDSTMSSAQPVCNSPLATSLSTQNSSGQVANDQALNLQERARHAKVLHVVNGEHYSGAERVQDLLAQRLPEFGFDVSFACVKPNVFPGKRNCQETQLFDTRMSHRFDLTAASKISAIVRENDIQILHAHTPRSALVGGIAARNCGIPFVFHVHSPTSRDSTRKVINWINQKIEMWSIRKASCVVTVSESLKSHMIEQGMEPGRMVVVPNGVPRQNNPRPQPPQSPFVIGTVALFRPRKGTEVLLQAMSKLRKKIKNFRLLAVGPFESPEYESQLKSMVAELELNDSIEWTGFTQDVSKQLARMNAFALPSLFGEGLPMVVLEAMSHGIPVVATDVEGIPQAVRNGVDGLIVPAGDAESLAENLNLLADDQALCQSLGSSGYERQQEDFSDISMARELARVYEYILQK